MRWPLPLLGLLLGVLALFGPTLAAAQRPPAQELFGRMLHAEQTLAFLGEVSEEIRFPEPRTAHGEAFTHPPGVTPELVLRNFELAITGRDEVAGREAIVLRLVAKNGVSPNWTFWVDAATGLRLAYEQRDAFGELLAAGRYQTVREVLKLERPRRLPSPEPSPALQRELGRLIRPEAIPDGFVPVELERTHLGGEDGIPALRLTIWDGLDGVVLLIYPRQRNVPNRPYLASRSLRNVTLSVLGPLPQPALETWLERLAEEPLRRLSAAELRRALQGDPSDRAPSDAPQDRPTDAPRDAP